MLVDTHVHLGDPKFARDLDRVVERARDAGIHRMVCIGEDMAASREAIRVARRFPGLRASVGVHPNNERRFRSETEAELAALAKDPAVAAIGEIGLDYHYPAFRKDSQIEVFLRQAALAARLNLPVVIHCRDAYSDLIRLLRTEPGMPSGGVVHCFAGTAEEAKSLMDLGFHMGVGGAMTYPNAGPLRETIRSCGLDRIVLETDAPYLPPQKKRGRRNEPSYLKFTVAELAELTGYTYQDVARITTSNALSLYGIEDRSGPEVAYSLRKRLYLNLTNRCTNDCCHCARSTGFMLYGHYLKLEGEPEAAEILAAIDDPDRYEEFVVCGLGEPTLRLDAALEVARALKAGGRRVRLNTNGHGNLIHGGDITDRLAGLFDSVAVTMNAHDSATYDKVSCPAVPGASFEAMIDFTRRVKRVVPDVRMRVVALPEVNVERCRSIAEDDLKVRFQVHPHRPNGYPAEV